MSRHRQQSNKPNQTPEDDADKVRLDKWLWAARFFKTRALAAEAIAAGKIKLDGDRTKTSHVVKRGERYVIGREGMSWDVEVLLITDKRGNGAAAALMYRETTESIAQREDEQLKRKAAMQAGVFLNHRPTKKDRRELIHYFERRDE
jgi:ribosome-associated heat shock protein Hsp15